MKLKLIISQIIFIPIILFFLYMGYLTINRGSLDYDSLEFVKGELTSTNEFVHVKPPNRYGTRKKVKVFEFSLTNCDKKFGVLETNDLYLKLKKSLSDSKTNTLELYFDKNGQEIRKNTTLHIFELVVNDKPLVSLKDTKKSERKGTLTFGIIGLLFLLLDIWAVTKTINKIKNE